MKINLRKNQFKIRLNKKEIKKLKKKKIIKDCFFFSFKKNNKIKVVIKIKKNINKNKIIEEKNKINILLKNYEKTILFKENKTIEILIEEDIEKT